MTMAMAAGLGVEKRLSSTLFDAGQLVFDSQAMTLGKLPTVRQIVAQNPRLARVFEKYGLSYCCCSGGDSLVEACVRRGIPVETILADLRASTATPPIACEEADWHDAPAESLVRHIVGAHHAFLHGELPRTAFLLERVTARHGELYPELWELHTEFSDFRVQIEAHLDREERELFPLLLRIAETGQVAPKTAIQLKNTIDELHRDHLDFTDTLAQIQCITGGFASPDNACNTYRVLVDSLREISDDLCQHLREEETILFPAALAAIQG